MWALRGVTLPLIASTALGAGCGVKFIVEQPFYARRVCSAAVVPIAIDKSQEEYRQIYYPQFLDRFRRAFEGRVRVVDWTGDRGLNWEEAVAEGRRLGADAVVGVLIDDSDYPPKRIEILKVVRASDGRVIVRQNRLIPPTEPYEFESELGQLKKLIRCDR